MAGDQSKGDPGRVRLRPGGRHTKQGLVFVVMHVVLTRTMKSQFIVLMLLEGTGAC